MVHMASCNLFILHSFGRSVVRSFGRSVVRSVGRSVGRSVVRSFRRSVVLVVQLFGSFGRLFVCLFFVCLYFTVACHLSLLHSLLFSAWPQVIFPCVIAVDKENE